MGSFVKRPGTVPQTGSSPEEIVKIPDIDSTFRNLYGFNLGFAAEKDMNDIRDNVVKVLVANVQKSRGMDKERDCVTIECLRMNVTSEIERLLSDTNILERAKRFADYKKGVEARGENCQFNENITS